MARSTWTARLWDPYPVHPSGSSRWDTLKIPDEELEDVARRERERRERGFGFAPVVAVAPEPKLWDGDQS